MTDSIELPHPTGFEVAREEMEALLRGRPDIFGSHYLDEDDGEEGASVPNQMLSDWLLVSAWIDEYGDTRYCRVNSPMSPHALKGLGEMFDD